MSEHKILQEWLDDNAHRQFPLDDTAAGKDSLGYFTLPSNLMLDMFLCVPVEQNPSLFFISRIVVRSATVDVHVSYADPSGDVEVGVFKAISTSLIPFSYVMFAPNTELITPVNAVLITGTLIVGWFADIQRLPGDWTIDYLNGKICSTRVSQGLASVTALTIGTQTLFGDIELVSGDNITITATPDGAKTILTISAGAQVSDYLVDDDSIVRKLTNEFGAPIRSINGMRANSNYDFQLAGDDGAEVQALADAHGVRIVNSEAKPCCDKSMIEDIQRDIAALNERFAHLEAYYETLSGRVGEVQSMVVSLDKIR